jgi:hypothetical protein
MSFWQKYFSRFHFYIFQVSANQQQDSNIHSHMHTDQTLTFTHRVNICCVRYIQCCVYGRSYLSILNNLHNMIMLCAVHTMRWYLKKLEDLLLKIKSIVFLTYANLKNTVWFIILFWFQICFQNLDRTKAINFILSGWYLRRKNPIVSMKYM